MAFNPAENTEGPVAAINVVPLVDVMLVLLVIFMITAPIMQQGVDVNLPKTTTAPLSGSSEQVVVSVNKRGEIFIGSGNKISISDIPKKLEAVMRLRKANDRKIYIKADRDVPYGVVMKLMGKIHQAGIQNMGLVSQPEDQEG